MALKGLAGKQIVSPIIGTPGEAASGGPATNGGLVAIYGGTGGAGDASNDGGDAGGFELTGGMGGDGTATSAGGAGGDLTIAGGDAGANNGGGSGAGGSISIQAGSGSTQGNISLLGGQIALNSGTVHLGDTTNKNLLNLADAYRSGIAITSDATETTIITYTPIAGTATTMRVLIAAIRDGYSQGAGYEALAFFRKPAGTVIQIGTTAITAQGQDNPSWNVDIKASSGNILVTVTGVAATDINWKAYATIVNIDFTV